MRTRAFACKVPVPGLLLAALVVVAVGPAQGAPGGLDTSFGTGGKVITSFGPLYDEVDGLALQPDGKIVAAGYSKNGAGSDFALARYKPNGSPDTGFGAGGRITTAFGPADNYGNAVVLQPNGKIVAAGSVSSGAVRVFGLARYNANGSLDTSFGTGGRVTTPFGASFSSIHGVVLQSDGKIVGAGYTFDPAVDFAVARYNANGSLDTGFGSGGKVTTAIGSSGSVANAAALQRDGKVVVAGYTSSSATDSNFALVRYNRDGSPDTSFGSGGKVNTDFAGSYERGEAVALQPDGKIIAAGWTYAGGIGTDFGLARYNPNGSLDSSFGSGGKVTTEFGSNYDGAEAVAVQLNGKIIAAGYSRTGTAPGSPFVAALARYKPNGSLDTTFGTGGKVMTALGSTYDSFLDLVLQRDGRIVAAGTSARTASDYDFALARYQGDTCVVPRLKGRRLSEAKRLIRRKGCRVGKLKKRFSTRAKKGRVLSQKPASGTKVAAAWKVDLVIGKGKRT